MASSETASVILTEVKTLVDQDRVLRFVGTTPTRDRMGDEIPIDGWDFGHYKKAPRVLFGHEYHSLPIGRTVKITKETVNNVPSWVFDVEFVPPHIDPFPEMVYQYCKAGFLNTVSVGFQSIDSEWLEEKEEDRKDASDLRPGKKFKKKQLLELSIVPIPANPEALMIEGKSLPEPTEALTRSLDDWVQGSMLSKSVAVEAEASQRNEGDAIAISQPSPSPIVAKAETPPATLLQDSEPIAQQTKENTMTEEKKEVPPVAAPPPPQPDLSAAIDSLREGVKALTETVKELKKPSVVPPPIEGLIDGKEQHKQVTDELAKDYRETGIEYTLPDGTKHRTKYMRSKHRWGELAKDEFSFVRFMRAIASGDWKDAPLEKEALEYGRSNEKKSIAWASGSAGGYWVPQEFLGSEFYMNFVANQVCRKAGIQVLPCTNAPVRIPRVSAGGTCYWVSQNANLTESSATPNEIQLSPKLCTRRVQISRTLADMNAGAAEMIVREEILRSISLEIDNKILTGPGTSGKPTGWSSTGSINTVAIGTNGGALTPAHIFSMKYALELDNVPEDGLAWFFHPRTWNTFRQTLVGADTYNYLLWQNVGTSIGRPAPAELLGIPVYTTTTIPVNLTKGSASGTCSRVYLVNVKNSILAEWGGMAVEATNVGGNAWAQFAEEFRAVYTCDVGVRDANSVCTLSDTTS